MFDVVDVDDENILSTIFRESFPESWRDNADYSHYLSELSSYGIDKLNREPDRLAEERAQILAQTQDLAFDNYKTFIQTAECSREIFQDFQIIERHVDAMLEKLPTLSEECHTFVQQAQQINLSRRLHSSTLARHTQLLEVLEIPQLMDTCVRSGYYDEALELATYSRRLHTKLASVPVVANIVKEVQQSMQLLLSQLLQQLRSTLQLPACLRVIGFLRRIDVFTEAELRIKFLQARDSWFQSILNAIPTSDPYHHITKTIEASRVHLFDIVTQYRAIFSDDDPLLASSTGRGDRPDESALFHGWLMQKVATFVRTLEVDLQRGVGGRLDSLLGQCMYFGLSFSRVGADFRALLGPVFQRAALDSFQQAMAQATAGFDEAMKTYTVDGNVAVFPASTAYSLAASTGGAALPAAPLSLLEHRPLAVYCNAVLAALNDLRLCAPLAIVHDVTDCLQVSLQAVVSVVLGFHRSEDASFNADERSHFERFCVACASELLPYLADCLQTLFPASDLAPLLGRPVSELARKGHVGTIDVAAILEPLQGVLPAAPDPVPDDPLSGDDTPPSSATTDVSSSEMTAQDAAETGSEHAELVDHSQISQSQDVLEVGESQKSLVDSSTEKPPVPSEEIGSMLEETVNGVLSTSSDISVEDSTSSESDVSVVPASSSSLNEDIKATDSQ